MLNGTIKSLAFGGQGIIRHEGLVIFVPFSIPGEKVLYQITENKKKFSRGKILKILQESPERVSPVCPYFGTCGGCQLQHISYNMQLEHKRQCIEDALKRIGHLTFDEVLPVIPGQEWGYRRHITLSLKPSDNRFQAGFIAIDDKTIIRINQCPLFIDPSHHIISFVQEIASRLECARNNEGKVTLFKLAHDSFLLYFRFKFLPKNCQEVFKNSIINPCCGISVSSPQKTLSWGQTEGTFEIEGLKFHFSPSMFIQNHPEQSLNIYRQILAISASFGPQKILDLYCGIGISSLLLAKQDHQVIGVECNQNAIHFARKNANLNQCHNLRFVQGDVQKVLPFLLKELQPTLIIVNPPREGLDPAVIQTLTTSSTQVILYVSCMPSTLARDLQLLCKERFTLDLIQPYDMFPQTAHVETLALMKNVRGKEKE